MKGNGQNLSVLDVVTIEKTGEFFRLIYDMKGRFTIHRITAEEAKVSFGLRTFTPCLCATNY